MGLIDISVAYGKNEQRVVRATSADVVYTLYSAFEDPKEALFELIKSEVHEKDVFDAFVKYFGFSKKLPKASSPSILADKLPGVDLTVKHPVTGEDGKLYYTIMSLNDSHKWTREAIAEWIENTFDTKDIAFPTPKVEEVPDEAASLSSTTKMVKIKRLLSS